MERLRYRTPRKRRDLRATCGGNTGVPPVKRSTPEAGVLRQEPAVVEDPPCRGKAPTQAMCFLSS